MRRAAVLIAVLTILAPLHAGAAERAIVLPAPAYDPPAASGGEQKLVVAGGCFWGVQGVFQRVKGVSRAVSGYAGGAKETARYDRVAQGDTGHAEAVEITYDPKTVSLGELLRVYFSVAHDPTQLNRQGPDAGAQYRSTIFVANAEQEKTARDYVAQLSDSKAFSAPIVTTLEPLRAFYPAEAYHQDYLLRHPAQPYIVYNDLPKIDDLKRLFPSLYRDRPALTN
ncbi:peptide-methionine (S)-S-oxide reductase MsrA [Methylocystis sp. SC2]|uniref:peptide-methionine (S)-S-oxide reductase MsrA n=1 Tax=Methylocystis sp. (strain SC2) TaxID=187303 RepID=UPI00027AF4E1|nr:peptide-methionine (S)-S-oxide reductase MsrA [Methylocystis sp. SC2]CCJ07874.1 Peptide methionine sulfoxide reductase MsrA 1 [Methylocystis sp. SC2]